MLKTWSLIGLSTILHLISVVYEDEIGRSESDGNETNLSNPFASKRSTKTGYITLGGAKKGGGNTKKGVKAIRDPNYLIPAIKRYLTTNGLHLHKHLCCKSLMRNGLSGLKLMRQAMPLMDF